MSISSKPRTNARARWYSGSSPAVLHPVLPPQLLDDELRIQAHRQPPDAALACGLQTKQQPGPFGDVVGRDPEVLVNLLDRLPVGVQQNGCTGSRTGIAAGTTVGEECRIHSEPGFGDGKA